MAHLLVVDDEPSILEFFEILLEREGHEVECFQSGKEAIDHLREKTYDLVITDLIMPEIEGLEVLDEVKKVSPETLVIMVTAYGTTESAVEAMKRGAYDYIAKPFKVDEIKHVIRNALEKVSLRQENVALRQEVNRKSGTFQFIGESQKIKAVFDMIGRLSGGRSSVLLSGESGTGKELAAKAIHEKSPRSGKPFVSINCAAIPENLIESEMFGYMKGSFTGASSNKMGLFEAAHGGTLFLDEVGELPQHVQAKLLRVLAERMVRRVGSTSSVPVDVRIISATNRNLETWVREGLFREDLYYRLNVIAIIMPPLRERPEDIPILAQYFLGRFAVDHGKTIEGFSDDALAQLKAYAYPGNVRELENIIEQCVALESGSQIEKEALPDRVRGTFVAPGVKGPKDFPAEGVDLEEVLESCERDLLWGALKKTHGVKKEAAKLLKISFRSLRYRLSKLGIDSDDEDSE